MNAREHQSPPSQILQQIRVHTDSADPRNPNFTSVHSKSPPTHAPSRTLSTVSANAMNALNSTDTPLVNRTNISKSNSVSTIRSVPSDSLHLETNSTDKESRRSQTASDLTMPHATKLASLTPIPHSRPPLSQHNSLAVGSSVRNISAEFGQSRGFTNINTPDDSSNGNSISPSNGQWSSAVGKANLGKSGRVIEKLMTDNDMLKREITLERLKAEDAKQASRMTEGKMEALVAEYDGKLHDAAINKTLLKRRERQVAEMKSQVESEKSRADKAIEREQGWKEAMEEIQETSKREVEEAQTHAALMDGRVKAMTSHWKDQGVEVDRTVAKLGAEIENIVRERRGDDVRMNMLQSLCDQQADQLRALEAEKQGIADAFERYKMEQEDGLKEIKERASEQERRNEAVLRESTKVLGELKWALGVKANVRGAR